ncbi:MAG: amidase [Patulibacter sp.]|nr:amidase [Patulibacter sp.]
MTTVAATLVVVPGASAINYVSAQNGESWAVNDTAMPGVDTGSIRSTNQSSLLGYGGIKVSVSGTKPDRLDGELLRGFGLKFDGLDEFATTTPVRVSGVDVSRNLKIERSANWARWVDSFTNRTNAPVTVEVSFGGILGQSSDTNPAFQASQARVLATSNGDTDVTSADSWAMVGTPTAAATTPTSGPTQNGTSATVIGNAGGSSTGGLLRLGNQHRNPFEQVLPTTGHEANFHGYVRRLMLQPGETRSLAQFVVIGLRDTTATAGAQIQAVQTGAADLAADPDLDGLSTAELCTIANWNLELIDAALPATCETVQPPQPAPAPVEPEPKTSSPYDVVGKTLTELQDDMRAGRTTSQEITRAYLDRIAAYDRGQRGLKSFIHVADDAMEQARKADVARAQGKDTDLLGIPVAVKDLYDTKDMPTTNGSLVFEGFRPTKDAFQVGKMREAGAVILGKANMSEYANSGRHSESAWGQVWNAIQPSSTSQGSSGGSGVAVAASFAAFSMGSQTGVSLNAPSGASSLVSLRGTDGMSSGSGVMPLNFTRDYAGPMARSVADLASILNYTTGTDPNDELTVAGDADAKRPADWTSVLDAAAMKGKRFGYLPSTFATTSYGTPGSLEVSNAALDAFREAGATLVPMPNAPSSPPSPSAPGASTGTEGWARWIEAHPESPYKTPAEIQDSQLKLPYNRSSNPTTSGRMTRAQVQAIRDQRTEYQARLKQWMDDADVEAVIYPNNTSDFHSNDSLALGGAFATAPASASGAPEVIVPVGKNENGHPVSLQLQGRAWDDAKLVGFAYAVERLLDGHVEPTQFPALTFDPGVKPQPIVVEPAPEPETEAPAPEAPTNLDPGAVSPVPVGIPVPVPVAVPAPTAPKSTATPRITVARRSLKATRSGRVPFRLSCAKGAGSCKVKITVKRGGRTIATRRAVTVKAGKSRTVTLVAKGTLKRSLQRGSRVTLRVQLAGAGRSELRTGTTTVKVRGTKR